MSKAKLIRVGDVVLWNTELGEQVGRYLGYGPFKVVSIEGSAIHMVNLDGSCLKAYPSDGADATYLAHADELALDVFMTAAVRAIKGTNGNKR